MAGVRLDPCALALTAAAVAGFAAPAVASSDPTVPPPVGTRVRAPAPSDVKIDHAQVRRLEKAMASCIVSRSPEMVDKILAHSDAVKIDYDKLGVPVNAAHKRLGLDDCLGRVMSDENRQVMLTFKIGKFRSNLAEESYLRRHASPLTRSAGWTEAIAERFLAGGENAAAAKLRGSFSDCLVFSAPAQSDALLRTQVESAAEIAAVKALVPAISGCLYEGDKLDFTPAMVRQYAADGLWARSYYQGTATAPAAVRTIVSAKRD